VASYSAYSCGGIVGLKK